MKKTSAFAEMLSGVVKESGIPVSKLALLCGLGRTAIQHVLSGDFLPTRAFLDTILDSLPVTHEQRNEITELYICEKLGKEQYLSNIRIKFILENILALSDDDHVNKYISSGFEMPDGQDILLAEGGDITDLCMDIICDEMKSESPYVAMSVPFSFEDFFHRLIHTVDNSDRPLTIDHYGRLLVNDEVHTNFTKLFIAMRFSLKEGIKYTPYYYYSKKGNFDDFYPAYPFCLATKSYVVMLDEQMSNAVVIHNEQFNRRIFEHMESMKKRSRKFFSLIGIDELENTVYLNRTDLKSIGYQPFFINLIPLDILREKLNTESRTPRAYELISRFYASRGRTVCSAFSSADGLYYFAKTGRINSRVGSHLSTFTPDERRQIFELIRENDRFQIIDPSVLTLDRSVHLFSLSSQTVVITIASENKTVCCRIDESLLVDGINAFIVSLDKAGLLVSSEKKSQIVDECMELAASAAKE